MRLNNILPWCLKVNLITNRLKVILPLNGHNRTNTHTHAQHQSHLIGLKTPSLHAVPPEGQYAVLETNCKEIKTKRLTKMNTELSLGSGPWIVLCGSVFRPWPVASIWKLKVSSADNFLLDFNLPCRFTIFIHPVKREGGEREENRCSSVKFWSCYSDLMQLNMLSPNAQMCKNATHCRGRPG